ncbi:porin family protein [Sphingomonas cannabina]|uniref:outer membrane protein n=1 Tax=Sphingomonas cannabina TaxID=2899123 RepID=UPI001F2C9A17|nr:porin family protein [Sphingomonas cannabina]UIJ44823.1 porin family protein [Sphingomonas cannabina]
MKKHLVAPLAALVLATPAMAQDMGGARVEAHVGYDRVNLDVDYDDGVDQFSGSDGTDGVAYGVEAGYDVVTSGVVLGVYAGLDLASTDYCSEIYGDDEACLKARRNITLGVRAGVPVGPRTLVYAKGGYSNGRVKATYEDFEGILDSGKVSDNLDGFHLGAGVQSGFGKNLYAKLEYVYTNYSGYDIETTDFGASADFDRHQVLLGLGVRF